MVKRLAILLGIGTVVLLMPWSAPQEEPEREVSYVWSIEEGHSLFDRNAELIRASFEGGWFLSLFMEDESFPGFGKAAGRVSDGTGGDIDLEFKGWGHPWGGYFVTHYLRIIDLVDTGSEIRAAVCSYIVPVSAWTEDDIEDRHFIAVDRPYEIVLNNRGGERGGAGIPDEIPLGYSPGSRHSPSWNVFGDWHIETLKITYNKDYVAGCLEWWQENIPGMNEPGDYGWLPTVPPGFEHESGPMAVRYPEWIGPPEAK